jgi:two-component system, LytTR family, response regulator
MIRAMIVEDAPLARKGIRLYLEDEPDIELVDEAADGPEGVAKILACRPDLLFLDVQMPGFDGFEVLERTRDSNRKAVIFITAHEEYALRAFDRDAVGYLLKPIERSRFRAVIARARALLRGMTQEAAGAGGEQVQAQEGNFQPDLALQFRGSTPLSRIVVKRGDRFVLLPIKDIDWIEASGEYVTLHTRNGASLLRVSLSELEARLDNRSFARIHRGTIVNLDAIKEIHPRSHGDCTVYLNDGRELRLSRNYRNELLGRGF